LFRSQITKTYGKNEYNIYLLDYSDTTVEPYFVLREWLLNKDNVQAIACSFVKDFSDVDLIIHPVPHSVEFCEDQVLLWDYRDDYLITQKGLVYVLKKHGCIDDVYEWVMNTLLPELEPMKFYQRYDEEFLMEHL
jgi:hypothetical protein